MRRRSLVRVGWRVLAGSGVGVACLGVWRAFDASASPLHAAAFLMAVLTCVSAFIGLRSTHDALLANGSAQLKRSQAGSNSRLQPEQLAEALRALLACAHAANWDVGSVVDGRYRILRSLAHGAASQVYLAEHLDDGHLIALKTVRDPLDAYAMLRLTQEAQLLAAFEHPNVPRLLDFAMPADGQLFLALEYAELGTLWDCRGSQRVLPWGYGVLADIACALLAIHERGWVHADISPANILLFAGVERPTAKLSDYERSIAPSLFAGTQQQRPKCGTRGYVAPEVLTGGAPTAASDVYALAVVAKELLAGATEENLPSDVRLLLQLCTAADPALRPSVREFGSVMESKLERPRVWLKLRMENRPGLARPKAPAKLPGDASRTAKHTPRLRALG